MPTHLGERAGCDLVYIGLWRLGRSRFHRFGIRFSTVTRGLNRLRSPWDISSWLHLLTQKARFVASHLLVQCHIRQSVSVSSMQLQGHRLFHLRVCCANYTPLVPLGSHRYGQCIELCTKLTSFHSLCPAPATA